MFTRSLVAQDLINILSILIPTILVAGLFYFFFHRLIRRLAAKTTAEMDNLLLSALTRPILLAIITAGIYLAIIYLPFNTRIDFEVRRGFHIAFILLGAWALIAGLNAVYRWFKLEVTSKTNTAIDDWIVILLRIATPIIISLLALLSSLQLFDINTAAIVSWLAAHGTRILLIAVLSIVLLIVMGRVIPPAIKGFVSRSAPEQPAEEIKKRADTLSNVLVTTGQVFIIFSATFIILAELNINITPILTGVGVAGIAIGFGAQSLVKDFLAGFFIIMEDQYRVGDVVRVAGISGLVEEINLRRTVLRDLDGIVHVVSNSEINIASNFTKEVSRVNLNISVGYAEDLDRVTEVINRVCKEIAEDPQWSPMIVKTPQVLRVDNLGDSGIELKILGDTKPIKQWDVMGEIRKRIKKAFDQEGIEIPWPHTKVYFGNSPFPAPPSGQDTRREDADKDDKV